MRRAGKLLRPRRSALHIRQMLDLPGDRLAVAPSDMVESDRSAAEHAANLDRTAWSDGIRFISSALAAALKP